MEIATLAAGCFWGIEAQFRQLNGVLSTRVGYMAGHLEEPTYKLVCTGATAGFPWTGVLATGTLGLISTDPVVL